MKKFRTEQEEFWAGEFGDEYCKRNDGELLIAANTHLFSKILSRAENITSVLEFGANLGANLEAIHRLFPAAELSAIEINKTAVETLKKNKAVKKVYDGSIFDFVVDKKRSLVIVKTVLIHVNPDMLPKVYELLHSSTERYICIAEYFSPFPETVTYRGNENKLFKRDFAGEMLKKYDDLKLVDYGFASRHDTNYGSIYDDINWFLLEKGR